MITDTDKLEIYLKLDKILSIDFNQTKWKQKLETEITKYLYQFLSNFNEFFSKEKIIYTKYSSIWNLIADLKIFHEIPNNINNFINYCNSYNFNIYIKSLYVIIERYFPKVIELECKKTLKEKNNEGASFSIRDYNIFNSIIKLLANFSCINSDLQIQFDNIILNIFEMYKKQLNKFDIKQKESIIKKIEFLDIFQECFDIKFLSLNKTKNQLNISNCISINCVEKILTDYKQFILNNHKLNELLLNNMQFSEDFIHKYINFYSDINLNVCSIYKLHNNSIIKVPSSLNFFNLYHNKIKYLNIDQYSYQRNRNIIPLILQIRDIQQIKNILKKLQTILIDGEFLLNIVNQHENIILDKFIHKISSSLTHEYSKISQIYFNNKSKALFQNPEFFKYFDFEKYLKLNINSKDAENIIQYSIKYFDKDLLLLLTENFPYSPELLNKIIQYLPIETLVNNKNLSQQNKNYLKNYLIKLHNLI